MTVTVIFSFKTYDKWTCYM